jgi:hypothetical protein
MAGMPMGRGGRGGGSWRRQQRRGGGGGGSGDGIFHLHDVKIFLGAGTWQGHTSPHTLVMLEVCRYLSWGFSQNVLFECGYVQSSYIYY